MRDKRDIEAMAVAAGMRMTEQRRVIAGVCRAPKTIRMSRKCIAVPPKLMPAYPLPPSIARALFEEANILTRMIS